MWAYYLFLKLQFPFAYSNEAAVCHVTGIKTNTDCRHKNSKKCKDIRLIFPILCKYFLKLNKLLYPKSAGSKFSGNIWLRRKSVRSVKRYCQNSGIESFICIPENNVNARNLLQARFKLFDEQTVDNWLIDSVLSRIGNISAT